MDSLGEPNAVAPSHEFRVPAVAGIIGVVCYDSAYVFFPKISDALEIGSIDHGLTELATHPNLAVVCQQLFAVADIALIVFMFGLAAFARPPLRSLAWLGSFLFSLSFALDLLVVCLIISATTSIAPQAARDQAMRAAGVSTLGFASVIDFRESYLWLVASVTLGIAAWRGRYWPRWLAITAILNGILAAPYLPLSSFMSIVLGNTFFTVWVVGLSIILWRQKPR